jgi:hypothetical protein
MVHLREHVAFKAAIGFLKQLPCHLEVHRCLVYSAVAEVRGQEREHPLNIFPFAIPGHETSHGKSVPKIMQARLITGSIESQYAGLLPEPLELMVGVIVSDHHSYFCGQNCRGTFVPEARPMSHSVESQDADKIPSDWNQSRLAELRFPDGQLRFFEIHVFML